MTLVDPIGDMFTRIRNGQMRSLDNIKVPASKFRLKILEVLKLSLIHISEPTRLGMISYAVFCLKKKTIAF